MTELDKIVGNHTIKHSSELKEQIKALFLELVGEDEEPGRTMGPGMPSFQRDTLRRELRDKINQL